jgi:hypothetical protein
MQTFLPFPHFTMSAMVLDRQRLGKQRVEALQILKALKAGAFQCLSCGQPVTHFNSYKTGYHCYHCEAPLKQTPWYNHPAVKMWKGYEAGLMLYLKEMCQEWTRLGYKDTCWEKAQEFGFHSEPTFLPNWFGSPQFHLSHQSNLLRKDPEHYGQFFFGVPDDLPYVWPTKL